MGADMLIAYITQPVNDPPPSFTAGHRELENLPVIGSGGFDLDEPELQLGQLGIDAEFQTNGNPTPDTLRAAGHKIIDDLHTALQSRYTTTIKLGGYRIHLSGGLSSGDAPTSEFDAILAAGWLPGPVLTAMGFVWDPRPPAA